MVKTSRKGAKAQVGSDASNEAARRDLRALPALVCILLAAVTVAVFWPATGHDFVSYDDDLYVYRNAHVQSGLNWQSIQWAFGNLEAGFWHPLTWLSILADCQVYGLHAWGHHLTSVLLHAASTVVLFLALQRMTGAPWRSALVAGLFGWHPLHVESVAWAAERKDVLSGFFWMLTLWAYVRYAEVQSPKAKVCSPWSVVRGPWSLFHPPSSFFYTLALVCFVCGLMSKPIVVTLPFVLLLLDYWPLQRFRLSTLNPQPSTLWRLVWEKVPFLAAALVFGVVTVYAEKGVGALAPATSYPLAGRVQNALLSYLGYLKQTLWPADLAVFYPYPGTFPVWRAAGAALVGLMISALVILGARKRPYLAVGWLWYVVTLLPVIGLIQVGGFSRADRFTYLPLIGVFLALTWGAHEFTRRWHYGVIALSAAGSAAIVLCLALTQQQLGYWKDSEALFRHALAVTKNNWLAHNNLGDALEKKGQTDDAIGQYQEAIRLKPHNADAHYNLGNTLVKKGQIDEAIRQFQEAVRLKPHYADVHNNLASALVMKGQTDEAIRQYQEAIRLKPDYALAHNNLGTTLDEKGQTDEAIRQFQEAIRLKPTDANAHHNLGRALARKEQWDEAIAHYQKALALQPDNAQAHYNLARVLAHKGRWAEAIAHYQQALAIQPGALAAQNNLAWLLATCPQAALRNGAKALALAQELDRLSGGKDGDNLDVLAAAYAEAGQFPQAVEAAGRALALAVTQTNLNAEEIRARLRLYQDRSPYHEQ